MSGIGLHHGFFTNSGPGNYLRNAQRHLQNIFRVIRVVKGIVCKQNALKLKST